MWCHLMCSADAMELMESNILCWTCFYSNGIWFSFSVVCLSSTYLQRWPIPWESQVTFAGQRNQTDHDIRWSDPAKTTKSTQLTHYAITPNLLPCQNEMVVPSAITVTGDSGMSSYKINLINIAPSIIKIRVKKFFHMQLMKEIILAISQNFAL